MKQTKLVVLLIVLGVFFSLPVLAAWDITQLPPGFTAADPGGPVELEGKVLFYLASTPRSIPPRKELKFSVKLS